MSGIRHLNFPAFESAENRLLEMGWEVVSPHRAPKMDRWEEYMRYDLKMLVDCDAIFLLKGYSRSRGALLELQIARELGLRIYEEAEYGRCSEALCPCKEQTP